METVATHSTPRGILRYSKWDALLISLSILHPAILLMVPSIPAIAVGLWWNSNTVSHNFIHLSFFRSPRWNRAYSVFLSLLLGFPQTIWRDRHLAHHAGHRSSTRITRATAIELAAVLLLWGFLIYTVPGFFWMVYLPGYGLGLGLCFLQGYFEHDGGTTSHYGFLYNVSFFNDGYHVEHHRLPGEHWTRLPAYTRPDSRTSAWPPVLRWIDWISIESLERIALRSRFLQRLLLKTHERAIQRLLPALPAVRTVSVIGGGMFPRTAILLRKLLPDVNITIVDANAGHIETAMSYLPDGIGSQLRLFDPAVAESADLVVIPLSLIGDRNAIYKHPPGHYTLVHDWIWSRHGRGAIVSLLLLKRINLVSRSD